MSLDGRLPERTDAELMRMARHDASAFRAIYDRHSVRLHAFLLRRTGEAAAAFELTAETFARAWLSRDRFVDRGDGVAPWLFGISRNLIAESVRRNQIGREGRRRVDLDLAEASAAPKEAWIVGMDEDLALALSELGPGERRAVELRFLEDSEYAEVARDLDISPGAARVRVHRALAGLRRTLSRDRSLLGPPAPQRNPGDRT